MPYIGEYIISLFGYINIAFYNHKLKKKNKEMVKENSIEKLEQLKENIAKLQEKIEEKKAKRERIKKNAYKIEVVKNDNIVWLILIMIVCLFTGLLTPLHGTPYTYLLNTIQGNTTEYISEHLPLTLINNIPFMLIIALFLIILIFTDTKIRLSDLFMICGLLLLAFKTRRQVSMYLLMGTVVLNRLTCSLFDKYDRDGTNKFTKMIVTIPGRIITSCLIILLSVVMVRNTIGNCFVDEGSYPVGASDYILENIDLSTMRLYNEYNYGSYLLFRGIPVFIDSRADLYTPEFNGNLDIFSDFINTSNIGLYYEEKMEEYDITHVIVYRNAKLNLFLSRDDKYKELYSDDCFVVYERGK